jgi:hypothetical protein
MRSIDRNPSELDKTSALEIISDPEHWLSWNGDMDNPKVSHEDYDADDESITGPEIGIKTSQGPEHCIVCAVLNVLELIGPRWRIMKQAEKRLVTVSVLETRRTKRNRLK